MQWTRQTMNCLYILLSTGPLFSSIELNRQWAAAKYRIFFLNSSKILTAMSQPDWEFVPLLRISFEFHFVRGILCVPRTHYTLTHSQWCSQYVYHNIYVLNYELPSGRLVPFTPFIFRFIWYLLGEIVLMVFVYLSAHTNTNTHGFYEQYNALVSNGMA